MHKSGGQPVCMVDFDGTTFHAVYDNFTVERTPLEILLR